MTEALSGDKPEPHVTKTNKSAPWWRGFLREPLVHFLAAGAILFGAAGIFNNAPKNAVGGYTIEIGANDVRQMALAWMATGGEPLTPNILQKLIDQKVSDEVLFREGMAFGLDKDDEIIKRRIAQKMDFLASDIAAMQEPEKAELEAWFSKNAGRFALPPRASFRQLYFSPDSRGAAARSDAEAALSVIAGKRADAPEVAAVADDFMLRNYYRDSTPDDVVKEFGPQFSTELFKLAPGGWRGPIQSGYGWHLVWIDAMQPGRTPPFEEVERDVRAAWHEARYQEIKAAAFNEMRAKYKVNVVPLNTVDMSDLRPRAETMPAQSGLQ